MSATRTTSYNEILPTHRVQSNSKEKKQTDRCRMHVDVVICHPTLVANQCFFMFDRIVLYEHKLSNTNKTSFWLKLSNSPLPVLSLWRMKHVQARCTFKASTLFENVANTTLPSVPTHIYYSVAAPVFPLGKKLWPARFVISGYEVNVSESDRPFAWHFRCQYWRFQTVMNDVTYGSALMGKTLCACTWTSGNVFSCLRDTYTCGEVFCYCWWHRGKNTWHFESISTNLICEK